MLTGDPANSELEGQGVLQKPRSQEALLASAELVLPPALLLLLLPLLGGT